MFPKDLLLLYLCYALDFFFTRALFCEVLWFGQNWAQNFVLRRKPELFVFYHAQNTVVHNFICFWLIRILINSCTIARFIRQRLHSCANGSSSESPRFCSCRCCTPSLWAPSVCPPPPKMHQLCIIKDAKVPHQSSICIEH